MRQAVIISRMREGDRCESLGCSFGTVKKEEEGGGRNLRVDWKEAVWAATRGGKAGMGLGGALEVGMEFDVQLSKFIHYFFSVFTFQTTKQGADEWWFCSSVELASEENPTGTGPLDLFDLADSQVDTDTDEWWFDALERWWSNGDERNRKGMWVQGAKIA